MLATNHGLVGTILGATLPIQYGVPIAFASHFLMDALPHYGITMKKRNSSNTYKKIVLIDTVIVLSIAVITACFGKWSMFWVGWVAYGPDGYWVYLYFRHGRSMIFKKENWFAQLHHRIQVFERPWGLIPEMLVLSILLPLYIYYLLK